MNKQTGSPLDGYSHIWKSALLDQPCTPTGREWPQADGTIRVEITDEDGSITAVLQTELVTVAEWRAAQSKAAKATRKSPTTIEEATDPARIEAYRLTLRAAGFAPIPCSGKAPHMDGWQRAGDATEHEIKRWTRARSGEPNTGLLTRLNPAVDLDVLDEEAAKAAEALVRERFGDDVFPVRFGKPPKRAILFRCDLPFAKLAADLVGPLGA